MATYWVSAVRKNNEGDITHLFIHPTDASNVYTGERYTVAEAIQLIQNGNRLATCRYTYDGNTWSEGAEVEIVNTRYGQILRTDPNTTERDNLDNMIHMFMFGL